MDSQRLRIALVTPLIARGDGQGRVNYEIASRAAALGHEVTLVTTRVDPDVRSWPGTRVVEWNVSKIPTSLLRSQVTSLLVSRWLGKHRREFDIVHINGSFSLAKSDVNSVHFVHDAWLRSPVHTSRIRKGLAAFYYRTLTKLHQVEEAVAFRRAKTIVAISERVREEIETVGVATQKIVLIHNGVDTDEFAPGRSMRAELGLPLDKTLVMFAGDMKTPRKNLDSVLAAVRALDEVHVVVVGSLQNNPYPAMAEKLGIADRVHFLGFRRDVGDIMRSVDAFVFPSRYEACSLVMLEALSSGLPVVTAITAGGAEIVAQAGGIVLDDPERVDLLQAAIARIRPGDDAYRASATAARETALRFSWSTMADKYIALYAREAASGG